MLQLGPYALTTFIAERFRLDGGAMFGMVPRVLWERLLVPDAKNRIPMVVRLLRISTPERTLLVDVGHGIPTNEKERELFAIDPSYADGVQSAVGPITDIVLTHLHYDHAGGVCKPREAPTAGASSSPGDANSDPGEASSNTTDWEPVYPTATHHLQRAHWENVLNPHPREQAAFRPEVTEILKSVPLNLTDDGTELLPGISVHRSDGHSVGMQYVLIRDGKTTVAFPVDLIPTAHHLPIHYGMGYDQCAERVTDQKIKFLEQAIDENWILVFSHDPDTPAATITRDQRGRVIVKDRLDLFGS